MLLKSYTYKKSEIKNWGEVFDNPSDIYLTSFQSGTVKINLKGALNFSHPLANNLEDKELEVPILSYWIHHPLAGDILLDTGLDASYIEDQYGGLDGSSVDVFKLKSNENIGFYIQKYSIKLKIVFLSHLHADHAAGVRELPNNIPYIIGKGEFSQYKPKIHGDFLKGLDKLYELDFNNAQDMPILGKCVDLLGDNSIWAVSTPGHSPGHISFILNCIEGPILLTMDAAFIYENLTRRVAPSDYTWDVILAQESLDKIIRFLEEYPQVRVGAGHEALK